MKTLLVDGNYCLQRALRFNKCEHINDSSGNKTGGVYGFLNILRQALYTFNPSSCIVVFDKGHSKRRLIVYENYKKKPDKTDEDKEFFNLLMNNLHLLEHILRNLGVYVSSCSGKEGDDVIWYLTTVLTGEKIILSDDWDMMQLVNDDVIVYRAMNEQIVSLDNFYDIVGLHNPRQYALYKAILGGKDNLPTVPGVGEKTIKGLLNKYACLSIHNLDKFLQSNANNLTKKEHKIIAHTDLVKMNYKLSDIALEEFDGEAITECMKDFSINYNLVEERIIPKLFSLGFDKEITSPVGWLKAFDRLRNPFLNRSIIYE